MPNREDQILKRHTAQIQQLQEKSLKLQETLLRFTGQSIAEADSDLAEIAPIETRIRPGATTTVLAFSGLATAFGMPPREFFQSLAKEGCNVLFIKDFWQCWYLRGLLSLSTGLDDTTEVLRGVIPDGTTSIRTVGASAGAYAAIQFGLRLNADRVLAFSPQTRLQPRVFAQFASPDSRKKDVDFESGDADLLNVFRRYRDFAGQIEIHYGRENATDRDHARHLEDEPAVHLIDHDADQHGIAKTLQQRGQLAAILAEFARGDRGARRGTQHHPPEPPQ